MIPRSIDADPVGGVQLVHEAQLGPEVIEFAGHELISNG